MAELRFEGLRRVVKKFPGTLALYQRIKPPPEERITRWVQAGQALLREHGLGEAAVTAEGAFFRSPWGAEFVYVPRWGAYGAERGELHEQAELEHLARHLVQGGTVLDVGANLGAFSLNLAARRPDLRFHALEPVSATHGWLRVNIRRNAMEERVRAYRLAVADRPGTLEITSTRHTDNHLVLDASEGGGTGPREQVPVVTLDAFVAAENIGPVALLKVDVEGAEPLVLAGAVELLRRDRPDLLLEVEEQHLVRFQSSIRSLEAFLATHGYQQATPPEFLPNNRLYVHSSRPRQAG